MLICSVQIISLPDSWSKFKMLTLLSGHHIGVPGSVNFCEHFDQYLKFGKTHRLKSWRSFFSIYFPIILQFLDLIHWMVFDLILYCVTVIKGLRCRLVCRLRTTDYRPGVKCKPQTVDFLTESCYHFRQRELTELTVNMLTGVKYPG